MPPTKTTKASKKKAPSKAPAKKAAKAAAKPVAKKAAKKAATPSKALAKKAPAAKKVAKAPAKAAPKKASKVAKKPIAKAPAKPAPVKAAPAPAKPVKAKPVKASIAEGAAPLVTLTRADATPAQPKESPKESRTPKRNAASLRYVNDAESDQTRGSVDELDSLDVIEADDDLATDEVGDTRETDGTDETDENEGDASLSPRDAIAAGPDGDEPLLTGEERAARKIEHTPETTRAFAIDVARALADDKCTDLVVLDVRTLSSLSDYIVVGSGTSDRQMHFAIKNIIQMAGTQGHQVARTSSDERKTWLIADFVDVIIHLFEPNTRAHYDIEMLWGDAPRLEWERPDQVSRDRAGLGKTGPGNT